MRDLALIFYVTYRCRTHFQKSFVGVEQQNIFSNFCFLISRFETRKKEMTECGSWWDVSKFEIPLEMRSKNRHYRFESLLMWHVVLWTDKSNSGLIAFLTFLLLGTKISINKWKLDIFSFSYNQPLNSKRFFLSVALISFKYLRYGGRYKLNGCPSD